MTDKPDNTAKPVSNSRTRGLTPFKPGFDKRRWLGGRGKKSPAQKEGEEILLAVIWEELSREFDTATLKPLEQPETVDALRLGVRNTIKKNFDKIMERIAGKVTEKHDITTGGESLTKGIDDERFNRAISSLTDAIRESLPDKSTGTDSKVDTTK